MKDLAVFRKFAMPMIAKAFFWVGFVFFIMVALSGLIAGLVSELGGVFILQSFLIMAIGIPVVRVISELLLMAHNAHENLSAIRQSLEASSNPPSLSPRKTDTSHSSKIAEQSEEDAAVVQSYV